MAEKDKLKFLTGDINSLTNLTLKRGQVYFAIDKTKNKGVIAFDAPIDANNTKRIIMSSDSVEHAALAERAEKDVLNNPIIDTYISKLETDDSHLILKYKRPGDIGWTNLTLNFLPLTGGHVSGVTTIDSLTAGDLLVNGGARFVNTILGNIETANKWAKEISLTIADSSGTLSRASGPFKLDGSQDLILTLPETIQASIIGHADKDLALTGGSMTGAILNSKYSKFNGNYIGLIAANCNSTFNEFVIKTKIEFANSAYMPLIKIRGYAYGSSQPIDLAINFYVYTDNFYSCGYTNTGAYAFNVSLATYTENNKKYVAINLTPKKGTLYFGQFFVDAYDSWNNARFSPDGWTLEKNLKDETNTTSILLTNDKVDVSQHTIQSNVDGANSLTKTTPFKIVDYTGTISRAGTSVNYNGTQNEVILPLPEVIYGTFKGNADTSTIAKQLSNFYTTRQASMNFELQNQHNLFYTVASSSTTTGKPDKDALILTMPWDNGGWGAQLALLNGPITHIQIRGSGNNAGKSVWDENWLTVLDSNNYTTYTVTKTGKGASGKWSIDVDGTAARAKADEAGNSFQSRYLTNVFVKSDTNDLYKTYGTTGDADKTQKIGTFAPLDSDGKINISYIPAAALERVVTVKDKTARLTLTILDVQLGDVVHETDTNQMYFVTNTEKLGTEAAFTSFAAGRAANITWSGVENRPYLVGHTSSETGPITLDTAKTTFTITTIGMNGSSSTYTLSPAFLPTAGGTMTGNISYKGSKATNSMIRFLDNTNDAYGNGISIGGGGAVIVGAGESASAFQGLVNPGTETLYLTADGNIEFLTNCDTIGNRVGVVLNTSRAFYPNANNTGSVGTSGNKWANMYATKFHGDLDGTAEMAKKDTAGRSISGTYINALIADDTKTVLKYKHPDDATYTEIALNFLPLTGGHVTGVSTIDSLTAGDLLVNGGARFVNTILGNIETASKLQTARALKVNLASTQAVSFDGSTSVDIGVSGTLPIANGGTGATTANSAANNLLTGLPTWTANPTDSTYLIHRDTNGGKEFGQVTFLTVWNYIKSKADSVYPTKTGGNASGDWNINAASATKWKTARKFRIGDHSGNTARMGEQVEVNGTNDVILLMPETIQASIIGHADKDLALTGGTMTGSILTAKNVYYSGDEVANTTRHNHAILVGHIGDDKMRFYEYGGIFEFYKSQEGSDTLLGTISSSGWSGNAATATKWAKPINFYVMDYTGTTSRRSGPFSVDGTSEVNITLPQNINANITGNTYEAYQQWGGKNLTAPSPVDYGIESRLGANRFAFLKPGNISIEYSRDGGSTWVDYGASDDEKVMLFTDTAGFALGKADKDNRPTTGYQLRATVDINNSDLYTILQKIIVYVSTQGSQGCTCTVQVAQKGNETVFKDIATDVNIGGWSGFNTINIPATILGTGSSQYSKIRFLFKQATPPGSTSSYYGLGVYSIFGYGGVGWSTPSNMAKNGHIYSYNGSQDAFFPARVVASTFAGTATKASQLTTTTAFKTVDYTGTLSRAGTPVNYNGTQKEIILSLPETIYGTFKGNADTATKLKYAADVQEDKAITDTDSALTVYKISSNNSTTDGKDGYIFSLPWGSAGKYGAQLYIDTDQTYVMSLRQRSSTGAWQNWKRIPMGDGTGASGTWGISISGGAAKLTTPRALKVNLASTQAVNFDGTQGVDIGVSGALPIANGGTGATTAANARKNLGAVNIAGDTMTGVLTMKADQYADSYSGSLNMNNSNIYGLNAIYTVDLADSPAEGINFYRTATTVDTLWIKNGVMYFNPNRTLGSNGTDYTVLHTGNLGNYYWANVKLSTTSNTNTQPTFGKVTVGGTGAAASSTSTNASIKTAGGVAVGEQMAAKTVKIDAGNSVKGCVMKYDTELNCLEFTFA